MGASRERGSVSAGQASAPAATAGPQSLPGVHFQELGWVGTALTPRHPPHCCHPSFSQGGPGPRPLSRCSVAARVDDRVKEGANVRSGGPSCGWGGEDCHHRVPCLSPSPPVKGTCALQLPHKGLDRPALPGLQAPGPSGAFQILGLGPPRGIVAPRAPLLEASFLEAWWGRPSPALGRLGRGSHRAEAGQPCWPPGAIVGPQASGPGGGGGRAARWEEEQPLSDVCLLFPWVCVS